MKSYYLFLITALNIFVCAKAAQEFFPSNTVVVFDLNDVLVKKDTQEITKKVAKLLTRPSFWRYVFSPFFWNKLIKYAKDKHCKESVFIELIKDYPKLADFEEEYISLSTSHKIIPMSLDIVKELKSKGYNLYIFSNMGIKSMHAMSKKYPELFNLFNGYYCPCQENNYNSKPRPEFYTQFKDYLKENGESDKKIIFIDDRNRNIEAAEKAGFTGILCDSIKNVYKKLQKLGILNTKSKSKSST